MAKRKGSGNVRKADGPKKKSPARKALGESKTTSGKKGPFSKGKRTAKRSGTS